MTEIEIRCAHDDVLKISELKKKFHPKNPNVHPDDQIERIAKILKAQGIRKPATISNQTGLITAGHGRILAAERAGLTHYPVDYQDYETEELEYADLTADNAVAVWADLDLSSINLNVTELGPDFDLDLLGIKDFVLEPAEKDIKNTGAELDLDNFKNFQHECPKCGFEWNDDGTT